MEVRLTGQTTMCVGVLLQNSNARMVVGTYQMKRIILRDHPILDEHRIITVENLPDELSGSFNNLLVFDNTAVLQLLHKALLDASFPQIEQLNLGGDLPLL
jgi:hypothetical protein